MKKLDVDHVLLYEMTLEEIFIEVVRKAQQGKSITEPKGGTASVAMATKTAASSSTYRMTETNVTFAPPLTVTKAL